MRRLFAAALILGACTYQSPAPSRPTMTTWPALDAKLLTDAAETYNFRLGRPTPLAVTPDGAVLFRRTPPRSFAADLFELDTKTGQVKTLLSATAGDEHLSDAEKARRERSRTATRGVVDVDVTTDGRYVMAPLAGKLLIIDRTTGAKREIDPQGDAYDPHLSPDGTHIAFVRGGDLWNLDVGAGTAKQLTRHAEGLEFGVADFAAQEELSRQRGWWWSPDGKQIVYQITDARDVDTIYVADARHPEKVPVPFKYPRAGTNNAKLSLARVAIDGKDLGTLPWDDTQYEYLARVSWEPNTPLCIVVLNREQTDLKLIAFDDAGKPTELLHDHDDAWLNVPGERAGFGYEPGTPLWLADGSGFYWMSESIKRDRWVIGQFTRNGKRTGDFAMFGPQGSPDGLALRSIVGLDGDHLLVETSGPADPLHSIVLRDATSVSTDDGVSTANFENGVLVVTTQLANGGVRTYAVTKDGKEHDLPSVAVEPSLVPTTKLETVTLEGRTHYVAITRPRSFDPAKKYPVILKVYGGPHAQLVDAARDGYVMDQWYADAGFIVVRSDNRGTPYRGRA